MYRATDELRQENVSKGYEPRGTRAEAEAESSAEGKNTPRATILQSMIRFILSKWFVLLLIISNIYTRYSKNHKGIKQKFTSGLTFGPNEKEKIAG